MIYNLLRTADGYSDHVSSGNAGFTLLGFMGMYAFTSVLFLFLMFRLHRPDVLPVGDLGIVKAVQKNYGLRSTPSARRIVKIGETWRPYRSIAPK